MTVGLHNKIRLIPKIEIKNNNLIKGINYEGLRSLGDPHNFINEYYNHGADEIIIIDIISSLYDIDPDIDYLNKLTKNIFIPKTYGGGLNSIEKIDNALRNGADKVYLNSGIVNNLKLLKDAIFKYGSSTIVLGVETQFFNDDYYIYTNYGREITNIKLEYWIERCIDLGIGEIVLNSIKHDGLQKGMDIEILKKYSKKYNIPIIASGGFGSKKDYLDIVKKTNCTGLAIASSLHYNLIENFKKQRKNIAIGNYKYIDKELKYDFKNYKKLNLNQLKS